MASSQDIALRIMEEEAARGWWDRNLFDAFREMIRNGNAASPPEKLGKAASGL
jgi:hypothetical protein